MPCSVNLIGCNTLYRDADNVIDMEFVESIVGVTLRLDFCAGGQSNYVQWTTHATQTTTQVVLLMGFFDDFTDNKMRWTLKNVTGGLNVIITNGNADLRSALCG